ncbi:MAG: TRAP transporter substrate-binding protein DctP [Rhodospirillum sp.]|nr:TRAP transporter substrate-binding protein DctP [Rhodospirillum sp.]MCF8488569.1 TRAP transporter substrate-binding protein DctP [Rhodospirillum sp.]MCF8499165.1 TRAP transporter substrate-binding protein DctP [Rhodospirillum sp.]
MTMSLRVFTPGRRLASAVLACAVGFSALQAQAGDTVDLTMGVIVAPGDLYSVLTASVPERISKATDGQVSVTVSDSLVAPAQVASAVRDGRLPMSAALHTYLAAEEPRMGIFNLPGLINNIEDYTTVRDAFWAEDVGAIWSEQWNAKVLAEGAWCTTRLFSKEPIHSLEDFKNKRLRVHNPQSAALMEALGAKPTPLPVSELMPALERGVIDGVFTSACVGNAMELWRVAKNVQDWGLSPITGWAILMNKDEWDRLSPDLQEKITKAMDELEAEAFGHHTAFVDKALKEMEAKGVSLWSASPEERAALADPALTQPAYDSWYARAEEVGFDGKAYIAKVKQALGR